MIRTGTYVLTFGLANVPSKIRLGYTVVTVDVFIPNPLRCFKCQRFGHGQASCRGKQRCFRCGGEGHDGKECSESPRCCNCEGTHCASSKDCPDWQREKEITKVKYTQNISFREAKAIVEKPTQTQQSYAAAAAKVLKSAACQTDLTWLNNERPSAVKTASTSTSTRVAASCQTTSDPVTKVQKTPNARLASTTSTSSKPDKETKQPQKPSPPRSGGRGKKGDQSNQNRFRALQSDAEDIVCDQPQRARRASPKVKLVINIKILPK